MIPKALGYRMPAEWEPHQATWVSWPHKEASWPGKLAAAQAVFARMVAALASSEPVHINVADAEMEDSAQRLLAQAGANGEITFHHFPTNDAWCRDHGAIFVRRNKKVDPAPLAALDWQYNAWGGKYPPFDLDNEIPRHMAEFLGVPRFEGEMILEGGSIDVNGRGLLLTTEACLLNPNRNPHLSRDEIETRLRNFLGIDNILWLEDGIVGDDTDGHIDDIARFVAPNVVVAAVEEDSSDENYDVLRRNWDRLHSLSAELGGSFEVVSLPMPPPVVHEGQRLPASYANFYIANRVVLLPGYDPDRDRRAARVLGEHFPDREIITIDCTDLIWGLGAFHCLTQQVPAV
jgi:agmatine deiminase